MIRLILLALGAGDILLLIFAAMRGGDWVINTQVGYWTSALVMGASMLSYARMVQGRLAAGMIPDTDDRDVIDRLDDPHDLYSDDLPMEEETEVSPATPAEIKAAIKEEKQRRKGQKRSPLAALQDSKPFMSIYRLVSYALLIFGFFYLNGNHLLQPLPYLIGLGIPTVVIVAVLMLRGTDQ